MVEWVTLSTRSTKFPSLNPVSCVECAPRPPPTDKQPSWGLTLCFCGWCWWSVFVPTSATFLHLTFLGQMKNWQSNILTKPLINIINWQIFCFLFVSFRWHSRKFGPVHRDSNAKLDKLQKESDLSLCHDAYLPYDPWHLRTPRVQMSRVSEVSPASLWPNSQHPTGGLMMMMRMTKVICHRSCCCTPT